MAGDDRRPLSAVPASGVATLVEVAADHGLPAARVLAGTGITVGTLGDRSAMVGWEQHLRAVRNVLSLVDVDTASQLAIAVGAATSVTSLGMFGFAAMSSTTIRELISTCLTYSSLTSLALRVHVSAASGRATLQLDDAHLPEDVRGFFVRRDVVGIGTAVHPFLGTTIDRFRAELRVFLRPGEGDLATVLAQMPVGEVVLDDAGPPRLELPSELLDEPLPQADAPTLRMCLAQCEELLQAHAARVGLAGQVRTMLLADVRRPPGVDEIARVLHVPARTLRRRLAADGTGYRDLLNEVRSGLAVELLLDTGSRATVDQIAHSLGYSETSAFTRAFVTWHGVPPSRYRDGPGTPGGRGTATSLGAADRGRAPAAGVHRGW